MSSRTSRLLGASAALLTLAAVSACDAPPTEPATSALEPAIAAQATAPGPAGGFPLVIVRQDPGAAQSIAASAPVVDNLADALDRVASGGTVRVMPGTYVVNGQPVDRPVTIVGAGSRPTLVPPDPMPEHSQALNIFAEGSTTIRNLHFEGFSVAIGISGTYDLVVIEDVRIEVPEGFNSGVDVFPPNHPTDAQTVVVQNSTVIGGWRGISAAEDVPDFRVIGNTLVGGTTPGSIAIGFSRGASGLIEGNMLSDCPQGCINVGGGDRTTGNIEIVGNRIAGTIERPLINPIAATGASVTLVDNVVEGAGGSMDPSDRTTWPIPGNAILIESAEHVVLRGNTVRGALWAYGIGGGLGTVEGLDNVADHVGAAVVSFFGVDGSLTMRSSDFTDYDASMFIGDAAGVDLTCNWWGSASGPVNANTPDPSVYTPWATEPVAGTSTTTCGGGL